MLYVRMALYALFAGAASQGLGDFDGEAFTVRVDDLATVLVGVGGYLATFGWSRIAKRKGGMT